MGPNTSNNSHLMCCALAGKLGSLNEVTKFGRIRLEREGATTGPSRFQTNKATMADEGATEKRSRKQTTFFAVAGASAPKTTVIESGLGMKLAENPHFCHELEKHKADSEECKALHFLLFNAVGKKTEIKKNLRAFSGFSSTAVRDDKKLKLLDKKKVWTVTLLKSVLGMLGLERGGDREDLANRLVDYLAAPSFTKAAKESGSKSKKRKSVSGKSSSKKAKRADRPKKAPSAYLLFCNERRASVRADNPEMSMVDVTKALAAEWNELSDAKKEVSDSLFALHEMVYHPLSLSSFCAHQRFVEEANRAKQALAAANGGAAVTTDDIDFGSDDEDDENGEEDGDDDEDGEEEEEGDSDGEEEGSGGEGAKKKSKTKSADSGAEDDFKDLEDPSNGDE